MTHNPDIHIAVHRDELKQKTRQARQEGEYKPALPQVGPTGHSGTCTPSSLCWCDFSREAPEAKCNTQPPEQETHCSYKDVSAPLPLCKLVHADTTPFPKMLGHVNWFMSCNLTDLFVGARSFANPLQKTLAI